MKNLKEFMQPEIQVTHFLVADEVTADGLTIGNVQSNGLNGSGIELPEDEW